MIRVLIAVLLVASPALARQAASPDPLVRDNATARIAEHVHVIPDGNVQGVPNVGIVVGDHAALVVDTGLGARNGATVLKEARRLAPSQALYLVTTHVHSEHDLGAHAFPAATTMIRSQDQIRDIEEFGLQHAKGFASRSPIMNELLQGAEFRKPDVTFEREHVLDLGGVRVRLNAVGGTHTRGDTTIFVEGDRVLFAGDVVMPAYPAFASPYARVSAWLAALDRVEALKPARIVPAHGAIGDAAMIQTWREYFRTLQARVRELKAQGRTADQAAETLQAEMQATYPAFGPANRVGAAARAAFAEAP
jgi:glyoxylase-like metal-dependent hydrolase (beta-lactamase superfamily II)